MARHAKPLFEKRKGNQLESAVAKRRRTQEEKIIRQPTLSSRLRRGKCRTSPTKNHGKDGKPKATANVGSSSSGPAGTESAAQPASGTAKKNASTNQVDDSQDKKSNTGTTAAGPTQQAPPLQPPSSPRPSITYRELWLARPRREAIFPGGTIWGACRGDSDEESETDDQDGNVEKEEEEEEEEEEENRIRMPMSLSPCSIRSLPEEA